MILASLRVQLRLALNFPEGPIQVGTFNGPKLVEAADFPHATLVRGLAACFVEA